MTKVIIVSKTHMTNAACIGALEEGGQFLRLLDENGSNQPTDTKFEIRQIWEVEYSRKAMIRPPHTEDVIVHSKKYVGTLQDEQPMLEVLQEYNVPDWRGSPDVIFNGYLRWTDGGSGYISNEAVIPQNSVGFWIPDKSLKKHVAFEKVKYNYPSRDVWRSLAYVGYADSVSVIPKGTLIRVSLARWWKRGL